MQYLHNPWPRLTLYVQHGDYLIDNNPAEKCNPPVCNWPQELAFSASQQGARASASLYSLIETANANELKPYAYLKKVFSELPNAKTLGEVEALLPWQVIL